MLGETHQPDIGAAPPHHARNDVAIRADGRNERPHAVVKRCIPLVIDHTRQGPRRRLFLLPMRDRVQEGFDARDDAHLGKVFVHRDW